MKEETTLFEPIRLSHTISGTGGGLLFCLDTSVPQQALEPFSGKAQAVVMDPPFMTGEVFTRKRAFGTQGWRTGKPMISLKGYPDRFGTAEAYRTMLRGLLENARGLLTLTGVCYLHVDWRASALARMLCDEVFGADNFLNEIIWSYESGGRSKKYFSRKHDTLLLYARGPEYKFNLERVPIPRGGVRHNHLKRQTDENGRVYGSVVVGGKEYRYYDDQPTYPGDVWTDISHLQQRDPERNGYPTQKPLKLLDRMLRPVVDPGDLVCDLCCGSGTALEAARRLGCGFIGVDNNPEAIAICENRLRLQDLSVHMETDANPAALYGSFDAEAGLVVLTGFETEHPAFPMGNEPFEALEAWGCGPIVGETLNLQHICSRAFRSPDLAPMGFVHTEGYPLGVLTVDAAGRRQVFRWAE